MKGLIFLIITLLGIYANGQEGTEYRFGNGDTTPLEELDRNSDFTLSDTEMNRLVGVVNADSVVVTINSGLTTIPGFVKFQNKATGFVAVEQGDIPYMNGDYKSQSGVGEVLSLYFPHADSCFVQRPSQLLAYTPIIPAINIFQGANALNATDDADSIGSGEIGADAGSTLSSIDNGNGTYSIRSTSNAGGGTMRFRIYFDVTNGSTYTFSIEDLFISNGALTAEWYAGATGHTLITVDSAGTITGTPQNFTRTLTATGDGTAEFEISVYSPVAADYIQGDNLLITEN